MIPLAKKLLLHGPAPATSRRVCDMGPPAAWYGVLLSLVLSVTLLATGATAAPWAVAVSSNSDIPVGNANSVYATADGGYVVGFARWEESLQDGFLKLDAEGVVIRERIYGSAGPGSRASVMARTADGGYVVAGYTWPALQADVRKLDADGNIMWTRAFDSAAALAVSQLGDGGYIVAGRANMADGERPWVGRLEADGNVAWQKTYGERGSFFAVLPIAEGYVVVGTTDTYGAPSSDAWVLNLDRSGNVVWQRAYGGPSPDSASAILPTEGDGYLVVGSTLSFGAGGYDGWLLELDANGDVRWQKSYGGPGYDFFRSAAAVEARRGGGYVLAGETTSFGKGQIDAWLVRVDPAGRILWQQTFGGDWYDWAGDVKPTPDGGYIAAGYSRSFQVVRPIDAWILKLDADGAFPGCASLDASYAVAVDSAATVTRTNVSGIVRDSRHFAAIVPANDVVATSTGACRSVPQWRQRVTEYHHAGFDHYFMTNLTGEMAALSGSQVPGWQYTGHSFIAYGLEPGTLGMCRFWSGQTYAPKSTHFFTTDAAECELLKTSRAWIYEGTTFAVLPMNDAAGCEIGFGPLYRLYNDGQGDVPNHRYTTSYAVRAEMIARGWRPEGEGVGIIGCVPAP